MTTSTNTTSQPSTVPPSLLNLPEGLTPDSIDILPVLYNLLSRLQNPQTTPLPNTSSQSQSQSQSSLQPPTASPPQEPTPSQSHAADSSASATAPLTIKEIHAATDGIRHKLQKARQMVKRLPDMDRGCEEQEEEIRELEEKIRRQREVLKGLAEMGKRRGRVENVEVEMDG